MKKITYKQIAIALHRQYKLQSRLSTLQELPYYTKAESRADLKLQAHESMLRDMVDARFKKEKR